MAHLGRGLQILGLIVLPLAMILQLRGLKLGQMLVATVAGFCLFYVGRIIEGYGRR